MMSVDRVKYSAQHYQNVFDGNKDAQSIVDSVTEPSLFVLINRCLSRIPGIYEDGISEDEDEDNLQENKCPVDEKPATTKANFEVVVEPAPVLAQEQPRKSVDSDSDAQSISSPAKARANKSDAKLLI